MKTSTTVWAVIILIVLGIGWYFYSSGSSPSTIIPGGSNVGVTSAAPMTAAVTYGPNGFSPSTVTIAKGGAVTFTNQSRNEMWVASDLHPTHEGYSGTTKNQHCPDTAGVAFDQCSFGTTYSFVFQKAGVWNYHNHGNYIGTGTVIVQ